MSRFATLAIATLAAVGLAASTASAALRSPQVTFSSASLQAYLNSVGESINVTTDQQDVQVWTSTVSGNSTFTLMIELAGNAASNNIGIYNGPTIGPPALYQIFPGPASAGWFAVASFKSTGQLTVNLFDATSTLQGTTVYSGVNRNDFGFYLQGPGGLFYSQDYRNAGGVPQMLTYAGTGQNAGSWWLACEDLPYSPASSDFDDAVLFLESVTPTPAKAESWGQLKSRYR